MNAGDIFGGCRILRECGSGAYGTVYLCKDALNRTVALKIFHLKWREKSSREGLRHYVEMDNLHPNLLKILHFGEENGRFYYVMEAGDTIPDDQGDLVTDTLGRRLQIQKGPCPLQESLALCHKILDALEFLHSHGMVHRDVKPDNILFVNGEPKLGDLDFLSSYSRSFSLAGTLGFIPPEMLESGEKKHSPEVDLYALGKIFYCCVTGNSPGAYPSLSDDMTMKEKRLLIYPLTRLCSKSPSLRPKDCQAFRELLPADILLHTHSRPRHLWQSILFSPALRWGAIAVACLLLCGVLFLGQKLVSAHRENALRQTEQLAVQSERLTHLKGVFPLLEEDLPASHRETILAALAQGEAHLAHNDSHALQSDLDSVQEQLRSLVQENIPPSPQNFDFTLENLQQNGRAFGFLHSPLVREGLNPQEWQELQHRLMEETRNLFPEYKYLHAGENCHIDAGRPFHLNYVPPSKEVPYPFWITPDFITKGDFTVICGYTRSYQDEDNSPVTHFCVNDLLNYCACRWRHFLDTTLPNGYILRPPTMQELLWWRKFEARGGLEQPVRLAPPEPLQKSNVVLPDTNAVSYGRTGDFHPSDGTYDFIPLFPSLLVAWLYSFRLVLAPGDPNFPEKAWFQEMPLFFANHKGHHYACLISGINYYDTMEQGEELALSLGAKLVEPHDLDEWKAIADELHVPEDWPLHLGAKWRDGAWRWFSDNTPIPWATELSTAGERTSMIWSYNAPKPVRERYTTNIICLEWDSEEAWERRADKWKNGTAGIIEDSFEIDGRKFLLLHTPMICYGVDSICKLADFVPAQLQDKQLRAKVLERYADFPHKIFIGAMRYYQKWRWLDGSEEEIPFSFDEQQYRVHSPMMERLVLETGKLGHALNAQYLLVEPLWKEDK